MTTENIEKETEVSIDDGPKNIEMEEEGDSVKKIPWYKFDNVTMSRGYCTVCNISIVTSLSILFLMTFISLVLVEGLSSCPTSFYRRP
jgi:hypothetical protein